MTTSAYSTNRLSERLFGISVIVILSITGLAKLVSAFGSAKVLALRDPLLGFSYREEFVVVGLIELIICACIIKNLLPGYIEYTVLTWFSALLLGYRFWREYVAPATPCHCMGILTNAIGMSDHLASAVFLISAIYLFVGGISFLCLTLLATRFG